MNDLAFHGFSLRSILLSRFFGRLVSLLILFVVLPVCLPGVTPVRSAVAAESSELLKIKKERRAVEANLNSLKKQLQEYQSKLNSTARKQKQTQRQVESIRKKIKVLGKLISENQRYLKVLDRDIGRLQGELQSNRRVYGTVSDGFRRTAVSVYKYGRQRDVEQLFSSGSVNDALVRVGYIGYFSRAVHHHVDELQEAAVKLESSRAELEKSYRAKAAAVKDQERQLRNMAASRTAEERALAKLKKQRKADTARVLEARRKRRLLQKRIEGLILAEQKAIEAENARRAARMAPAGRPAPSAGKAVGGRVVPPPPDSPELLRISADFDKAVGQLPWPVSNGRVSQRFGPFKDKELNIVTTNNGIDISVPANTIVKAVSGGKVARIAFMPTFGHIVIIRHPKSYLTVYANLGSIRVAQNELLSSQQVIGASGKNLDGGSIVHFEIWKGRLKQNPETWLRK
ncbi:peptidase M23 [Chlorobium phaeovibrioides]|uniref:Peptidase M23 n=1 Tax=Chlorobium phaeovibrioides TaxID=1094 RepID=A0A3S0NYY8_CHLPH|nr:peptidoglycan DD-metalloendopeptidase family protein [Chlorobium phaeovibrioides]RTY37507.1 peptidase M23 [Chlorobium phaeovibrioides]